MPPHRKPPWARQERGAKRRNEPGEGHGAKDRHRAFAAAGKGEDERALIYGLHAVGEALANPKREVLRFLVTENALRRLDLRESAKPVARPEIVSPQTIARLLPPDAVHQGALVEALPLEAPALEALAPEGIVLALDQITDPHNVGAILRTAAAFAVRAVIVPVRHSPAATGVLAKSASGALEHVPLIPVRNLADALIALGERGFLRVGLDSEGEAAIEEVALGTPLVLALGAEGRGLRDRVRQSCDALARIDLPGSIKSLNVSNAAAIALATAHRRIGVASGEWRVASSE
jgi:23S rRNA (guanosine2251-2'-O)-methyltransferase